MKTLMLFLAVWVLLMIGFTRQSGRSAPPPDTRPKDPKPPTEEP